MMYFTTSQQKEVLDCIDNIRNVADNYNLTPVIVATKDSLDMNTIEISYAYFDNSYDANDYCKKKFDVLCVAAGLVKQAEKIDLPVQIYVGKRFISNHVSFGWVHD